MSTPDSGLDMESKRAHIEKLGRERPAKFKTALAEILFCYSVIASQFMAVSPLLVNVELQALTCFNRSTLSLASMSSFLS